MGTEKKRPLWQWGLIIAVLAVSFMVYVNTMFRWLDRLADQLTQKDLVAISRLSEAHQEFIDQIRKELGVKNKIGVLMLYKLPRGRGGILRKVENSFVIWIEYRFWLNLDEMEQKAFLAHELGHIIFAPPRCLTYLSCQQGADQFSALHTSSDATIRFLNKLFDNPKNENWKREYRSRIQHIEKLKQGR